MANGVQALDKKRQVIVMCGDGGFAMLMQEFMTSAQHGLPVKVFVFNNSGWGLVHLEMEEAGLPVFSKGAQFKNPDFAMFAEACGGRGFRVTQPQALRETIASALSTPGPSIVDVVVDPSEIPSMPHVHLADVWKFGIGKIRELTGAFVSLGSARRRPKCNFRILRLHIPVFFADDTTQTRSAQRWAGERTL